MTDKKLPAIVTDLSDSSNNDQSEDPSTLIPTPSDHTKVDIDLLSPHSDPSNPFAYIPTQLASLMDPKNLQLLASLGGLEGVAKGLHADVQHGLSPAANIDSAVSMSSPEMHPFEPSNNFDKRIAVFGTNRLPEAKAKNIFQLMFLAFRDKTLVFHSESLFQTCMSHVLHWGFARPSRSCLQSPPWCHWLSVFTKTLQYRNMTARETRYPV